MNLREMIFWRSDPKELQTCWNVASKAADPSHTGS